MAVRYSAQSGNWTNPSTWQGGTVPQAGDQVVIQSGHTVIYNVVEGSQYDVELGTSGTSLDIDIYGTLKFDTNATQNLRLRFKGYVYVRDGGRFECGTDTNPMPPVKVTIQKTVAGYDLFRVALNGIIAFCGSPNLPPDGQGGYKIYTTLAAPASSGSNNIRVAENLNWQVGDYIGMPRAVGLTTTSYTYAFDATVTNVTDNGDGTYTLTLSNTLPQNYIAGTPVVKLNRLIQIIDPNTSSGYNVTSYVSTQTPVESVKWVQFHRPSGDGQGALRVAYFPNSSPQSPYRIEYVTCTPLNRNYGIIGFQLNNSWAVLRRCAGNIWNICSGWYLYVDECIMSGVWNAVGYATAYIRNSILFNPYIGGNMAAQIIFENCIGYSPSFSSGASIDFINCTFYGLGNYGNYMPVSGAHTVKFKSCTFRYGCDGSTPPRFDWATYNVSQRWFEVIDCQFYDTWVEPSGFSNNAYFPEHKGSHPLPFVRFINKRTTNSTIAEQIFRAGGVITSINSDVPTPTVPYAYLFEPKNASFPLVHDIEQASGQLYRVWVKAESGSPTVKLQVIRKAEAVLLPTLVTPINELTLTPPATWTAYLVPVPADCVLRIATLGSSGSVKIAWERVDSIVPEKTLTDNLKATITDMVAKTLHTTLPQGY